MNFIESPEMFLIMASAYAFTCFLDFHSSLKTNWYYGVDEANRLMRDKDGNFSLKKGLLVVGIMFGVSVAIGGISAMNNGGFWAPAWAMTTLWTIGHAVVAFQNQHKAKQNRALQIAYLQYIRDNPGVSQSPGLVIGRNGKRFAQLFHWLWVPMTGDVTADVTALTTKIYQLSINTPEANWFPG